MKTDDAALAAARTACTAAHGPLYCGLLTLDKIGVSAHTFIHACKCMRDEEVRQPVTHSLGPFRRGACVMRHPRHFSPPFYSSSLPAAGRRRSLLRPLSGSTAALRRRYGRVDGVSNSPCGSIRRGFLVQISRNCRLYLCKHPPSFPRRACGN